MSLFFTFKISTAVLYFRFQKNSIHYFEIFSENLQVQMMWILKMSGQINYNIRKYHSQFQDDFRLSFFFSTILCYIANTFLCSRLVLFGHVEQPVKGSMFWHPQPWQTWLSWKCKSSQMEGHVLWRKCPCWPGITGGTGNPDHHFWNDRKMYCNFHLKPQCSVLN